MTRFDVKVGRVSSLKYHKPRRTSSKAVRYSFVGQEPAVVFAMASVDVDQASSIPLPLSPPAVDQPLPTYPAIDATAVSQDTVAEPTPNGESVATEKSQERDTPGIAHPSQDEVTAGATEAAESRTDAPSVETTAEASVDHDSSSRAAKSPPPPPPAKTPPEVRSPPPRHDSLASGAVSPNGLVRPSEDHRLNGLVHSANSSRPASPASLAGHRRSLTISRGRTVSAVLITSALETIAASKEARRSQPLKDSVQRALELVKSGEGGDRPREIFEPLRLACETRHEKLMIASLDCISKLISYSFFAEPVSSGSSQTLPSPPPSPGPGARPSTSSAPPADVRDMPLVDLVVNTITSCHTESTPETVSLQIVKALLALVLSSTILVHQSSLLKAVRTVYNVFLLSVDPINQTVAQGGLTQMVNHVFARCKLDTSSLSRRDSTATLASTRDSSRPLSVAADSPDSGSLPQSPAAVDNNSIADTTVTGTTAVGTDASKVSLPVDTPSSGSVDLPPNDEPESQASSASRQPRYV